MVSLFIYLCMNHFLKKRNILILNSARGEITPLTVWGRGDALPSSPSTGSSCPSCPSLSPFLFSSFSGHYHRPTSALLHRAKVSTLFKTHSQNSVICLSNQDTSVCICIETRSYYWTLNNFCLKKWCLALNVRHIKVQKMFTLHHTTQWFHGVFHESFIECILETSRMDQTLAK